MLLGTIGEKLSSLYRSVLRVVYGKCSVLRYMSCRLTLSASTKSEHVLYAVGGLMESCIGQIKALISF